MNKGYVKLYRKFWDNPLSQKPNYLAVFLYLLSKANHTDKHVIIKNEKRIVKRGQYFGSMKAIAEQFKMQRSTVKYIFDYFIKESIVSVQEKNTNFTFVTVNNYNEYQDVVQEEYRKNTGIITTKECKALKHEKNKDIYIDDPFLKNIETPELPKQLFYSNKIQLNKVFNKIFDGWDFDKRGNRMKMLDLFQKQTNTKDLDIIEKVTYAFEVYCHQIETENRYVMRFEKWIIEWENWYELGKANNLTLKG